MKTITLKQFKKELFRDKVAKKAYDDLEVEFSIISQIIDQRIKKGISQKDMAAKMGTQQPAIARFESGRYNPTLSFLKKVSEALGTKLKIKFEN